MKKKYNVVLLPTEGKCRLAGKPTERGQVPEGTKCYSHTGILKRISEFFANGAPDPDYNTFHLNGYPNSEYNGYSEEYWQPYCMYITDNSAVIVEGDWVISGNQHLYQIQRRQNGNLYINGLGEDWSEELGKLMKCQKVISCNDPQTNLPSIRTADIQKWIDAGAKEIIDLDVQRIYIVEKTDIFNAKGNAPLVLSIKLKDNYIIPVWDAPLQVGHNGEEILKHLRSQSYHFNEKLLTNHDILRIINAPEEYILTQEEGQEWQNQQAEPMIDIEEAARAFLSSKNVPNLTIGNKTITTYDIYKAGWQANPAKYTEKQLLGKLIAFGEHVSEKCTGSKLSMIGELQQWLADYDKKQNNG